MSLPEKNRIRPGLLALAGLFLLLSSRSTPKPAQEQNAPPNLALAAKASAFESYQGMTPELAVDGFMGTRWSGVPGHDAGGWFALDWDQPVRFAELIVFQHGRYVNEMDVQIWDGAAGSWKTVRHLGARDVKLPRVVVCDLGPQTTARLRLAGITGGPSFTEVQVFEKARILGTSVHLASDADGRFIGVVCDDWGSSPVEGAEVALSGQAKNGEWRATARSDRHGLFIVPMPLGLAGKVAVSAHPPGAGNPGTEAVLLDAAGFQYGLTPENLQRRKIPLDGPWRFAPDPPAEFWKPDFDDRRWPDIKVPAHFEMEGFRSSEGIGGYRTHFRAPAGAGRLKLLFDGVYSGAEVWVNGLRLAYHEGGALPFEVDVTEAIGAGDNLLAVRVTQRTVVSEHLDKMSEYADFPLAGIMRPVYLFRVPAAHIGALAVETDFDAAFRNAVVKGRLAVLNESDRPLRAAGLRVRLLEADGKTVRGSSPSRTAEAGPWRRTEIEFDLPVSAPKPWEAEHPNLYTLEITLENGAETETLAQKIGFRQTDIREGRLLINGRPVKIRGTCHHDSDPVMGRAVTAELERRDLELIKEANLNAVRTSHYPPLPALLDVADEVGIYVEDEGSFCWADAADDLRLAPRIMQLNAELLARDRNHPSVFIWSLCNESDFGEGFKRSHEWMRAADPSRPDAGSYERDSLEILARHNPITPAELAAMETVKKPVLWDESWCVFQGIFGDVAEMWVDPGIRDYYAEPLPAIYRTMMRQPNIAGTQIWAWSDDIFAVPNRGLEYGRGFTGSHFLENAYRLPGRGLVGDAPWGVVDGWRRKKPEFWITKKLHSPVKIEEAPLALPADGAPLRVAVENQYDFTDLAELQIHWEIGREMGTARLSAAPRSSGALEIRPKRKPIEGDVLSLEFAHAGGRLVDSYRLPIGRAIPRMPALRGPQAAPLRILMENYLAGPGIRVLGQEFELAFDQSTGELRRAVAFGEALLLESPKVHVLPTATPASPLPDPLSWRLDKLDVQPEGENVRAKISGRYDRFEGGYDILITPAGEITVRSSFKYSGEKIKAREIGLAFSAPLDSQEWQWERRGEWSVYPGDHIGRPRGEARAFADHEDAVPPRWPWSEDNSPMGSNDFRSTKRHIFWASIGSAGGPAAWILSDGNQHARAAVDSDRVRVVVSDWYGGTHVGLSEWSINYGEGREVSPGQVLESTLRLRLAMEIRK